MTVTAKKPKRRPCPLCGRRFLRGGTVLVLHEHGLRRRRVCATCVRGAIRIAAPRAWVQR